MKTPQEYVQLAANLRNLASVITPEGKYSDYQKTMQAHLLIAARQAEAVAADMAFSDPRPAGTESAG